MHVHVSGDMSRTVSLDHQVIKYRRYRGGESAWKYLSKPPTGREEEVD
jgi:hypothetical protein